MHIDMRPGMRYPGADSKKKAFPGPFLLPRGRLFDGRGGIDRAGHERHGGDHRVAMRELRRPMHGAGAAEQDQSHSNYVAHRYQTLPGKRQDAGSQYLATHVICPGSGRG